MIYKAALGICLELRFALQKLLDLLFLGHGFDVLGFHTHLGHY